MGFIEINHLTARKHQNNCQTFYLWGINDAWELWRFRLITIEAGCLENSSLTVALAAMICLDFLLPLLDGFDIQKVIFLFCMHWYTFKLRFECVDEGCKLKFVQFLLFVRYENMCTLPLMFWIPMDLLVWPKRLKKVGCQNRQVCLDPPTPLDAVIHIYTPTHVLKTPRVWYSSTGSPRGRVSTTSCFSKFRVQEVFPVWWVRRN